MRYYVSILVSGEIESYYRRLIMDISSRFGLEELSQKNRSPHITFKSPFNIDSSKDIERILEKFSVNQLTESFQVSSFGYFGRDVYLNVSANNEIREKMGELLNNLKDIPNIPFDRYDNKNKTLHITVARGIEMQDRFEDVWNYVSLLNPNFQIPFDNITLSKKEDGKTLVEKTFDMPFSNKK